MERLTIECLSCGERRRINAASGHGHAGECPRCGYLGWAPSTSLTESVRRRIRERPVDRRATLYAL